MTVARSSRNLPSPAARQETARLRTLRDYARDRLTGWIARALFRVNSRSQDQAN